ncbi:hypothetical protein [Streptomyces sp. NPDC003635]
MNDTAEPVPSHAWLVTDLAAGLARRLPVPALDTHLDRLNRLIDFTAHHGR